MRVLHCPAAYERFVIDGVQKLMAEASRDAEMRADDDERIRKFASVPSRLMDRRKTGTLAIIVGVEDPAQTQLELEPREARAS